MSGVMTGGVNTTIMCESTDDPEHDHTTSTYQNFIRPYTHMHCTRDKTNIILWKIIIIIITKWRVYPSGLDAKKRWREPAIANKCSLTRLPSMWEKREMCRDTIVFVCEIQAILLYGNTYSIIYINTHSWRKKNNNKNDTKK